MPNPENINTLQKTSYKLEINKFPNVTYFCQSCNIPGLQMGQAQFDTMFSSLGIPGDKVDWDMLSIKMIVAEDLSNWLELFDWITKCAFVQSFEQRRDFEAEETDIGELGHEEYSDATLHILSNQKNPIEIEVSFKDIFPVNLGSIEFDSNVSDEEPHICSVEFQYQTFTIESPKRKKYI